jgi:hypothetical protein
MIERFLFLKDSIKKTLQELGKIDLYNLIDFEILEILSDVLKPIYEATKELGKANVTILEGDIIMEVLCLKLSETKSKLGEKMLEAIKKRYEERKNVLLISAARYLQNPRFFRNRKHLFSYSTKQQVCSSYFL